MSNTILDALANAGQNDQLITAFKQAGLDTTLSQPGPFTLFAPSAATAALPDRQHRWRTASFCCWRRRPRASLPCSGRSRPPSPVVHSPLPWAE